MIPRIGQVIFVRYGDHVVKERKAIILDISNDEFLVCILPTSSDYDDPDAIFLDPKTRWGRNLGLDRDTWLYARNIVTITEEHFMHLSGRCRCHPSLMEKIFTAFEDVILSFGGDEE